MTGNSLSLRHREETEGDDLSAIARRATAEAIQTFFLALDCFAALAMTENERPYSAAICLGAGGGFATSATSWARRVSASLTDFSLTGP
jgi:hypothetical protein